MDCDNGLHSISSTHWELLPQALAISVFLLALVLAASMMPVENLPQASWQRAFELGSCQPSSIHRSQR